MNRIFKFRQWHPGFEDTGVKPHMEEPIEWLPSDRFSTWMQWTGLTDKNGKEIYEGDIVKQGDDTFGVYWNGEMAAFALTNRHGIPVGAWGEMEVIGNIYENPELLSEGKEKV